MRKYIGILSGLLSVVLFMLNSNILLAQLDTAFWFAAPEVSIHNQNFDRPIIMRFTSSNLPSVVTVSQPANPGFIPLSLPLAAHSTGSIDLTTWIDIIENKPPNQVLNYGLKVTATQPVSAYYEVVSSQCLCNPEIFSLKGRNALGTEFYIPMQNFLNNSPAYTPLPYSSFDIIATEDNTQVMIIPTTNLVGHTANIPFSVSLNRGQTYSATAAGQLAAQHPAGSRVVSNRPIAITVKDDLLSGGPYGTCADLAGDQIIPVTMIGDEYIVVRGFLYSPYDKVFVLAIQNNTSVSINGTVVSTLNTGQTYEYSMGLTNAAYITSSAPVYVWHLSGFGCEVGLSILPPIHCTGSASVSFTRSSNDALHLTLLAPAGSQGNFLMNGAPGLIGATAFNPVPGTGGLWQYAQISFTTAQIPVNSATRISNTSHLFHLGIIHGSAGGGCRFGYFSDFAKYRFEATANPDTLCVGDSLAIFLNNIPGSSPLWSGPAGFSSTGQNVTIAPVQIIHQGYYYVTGTVGNCPVETDSVYIHIHSLPQPQITTVPTPPHICPGDTLILNAQGGHTYLWSGGLGTGPSQTVAPLLNTTYTVHVTDSNGCKADTSIVAEVFPLPVISFQPATPFICKGDSIQISVSGGVSYIWSDSLGSGNVKTVVPASTSNYTVWAIDNNGCESIDSITVTVHAPPIITVSPSHQVICSGDTAILTATGGVSYIWNPGSYNGNPFLTSPLQSTVYLVAATDANGCSETDSASVEVLAAPVISIAPDTDTVCPGESVSLNALSNIPGTQFTWSNGTTGSVLTFTPSASLVLTVAGVANGCTGTQTAPIVVLPDPEIELGSDSYICPREKIVLKPSGTFQHHQWWDGSTADEKIITHPGTYWVIAWSGNCSETDSVVFLECPALFIPNAFVPNGDGQNDRFIPVSNVLEMLQMDIFDRLGRIVFSTNTVSEGWDGTYEGGIMPEGVYVYLIRYYNPKTKTIQQRSGTVHLFR